MQTITREEIRKLIDRKESFLLVEALPESFYEAGHLPGAIVIPAGYVAEIAPRLISDKKVMVIVYCGESYSQHSLRAVEEFRALGYGDSGPR